MVAVCEKHVRRRMTNTDIVVFFLQLDSRLATQSHKLAAAQLLPFIVLYEIQAEGDRCWAFLAETLPPSSSRLYPTQIILQAVRCIS
jgi:hypothetical protein